MTTNLESVRDYQLRVPHPRDVFVFVARVENLKSQLSNLFVTINSGCPILATPLFLSLGWETSNLNLAICS
jgi:hypothetical protein